MTTRVNYSTLKRMWDSSPLHYHHGVTTTRPDTAAMMIGRATHCAILEPEMFDDRYAITPEYLDRRTVAGKAWVASVGDREILSASAGSDVASMAAAVMAHPVARAYLSMRPHETERDLVWTDDETGAPCRGTPDRLIYHESHTIILGVKTTRHIEPTAFARDAWRMGYHLQWAYYHDAVESLQREHHADDSEIVVVEIVVESSAPHDVVVYRVPEHVLDIGRTEYRDALVRILDCRRRNEWPGHAPDSEVVFEPPPWARVSDTDSLDDCTGLEDAGG